MTRITLMPAMIKDRADAKATGRATYLGGLCKHGHGQERLTRDGSCVQCDRERRKVFSKTEIFRKRRRLYEARYRKKHSEKFLAYRREWRYGINKDTFDQQMIAQKRRCAICRTKFTRNADACIDHNHETGNVRGLLCHPCNTGLGYFRDEPIRLKSAARYLEVSNVDRER
jgi:hypothetical protein